MFNPSKAFRENFDDLTRELDNRFKYVEGMGWILYNLKVWKFVSDNTLEMIIAEWLAKEFTPINVKKFYDAYKIYNTIQVTELNKNKNRIVFENGTFDLSKFSFDKTFYKYDFVTAFFNFDYDVNAKCPTFDKYLDEVMMQDESLKAIIKEMLGYCLLDDCRFEKAFILYGDGATGKSVLLKTISDIWGTENCSNVPFDRLQEHFMRAGMYGKKINFSSELESDLHNTSYFKAMVSGEEIDAQFKFKDVFKFKNTAKMVFAMNNLPAIKDKTNGTYRRLMIIPFNRQFAEHERDVKLVEKLLKEKSGIINHALLALKCLIETNAFTYSKRSDDLLNEHKENNDVVALFANEYYEVGTSTNQVKSDTIYYNFKVFCDANGFKPLNNINFFKRFYNLFPKSVKKRVRIDGELVYVLDNLKLI